MLAPSLFITNVICCLRLPVSSCVFFLAAPSLSFLSCVKGLSVSFPGLHNKEQLLKFDVLPLLGSIFFHQHISLQTLLHRRLCNPYQFISMMYICKFHVECWISQTNFHSPQLQLKTSRYPCMHCISVKNLHLNKVTWKRFAVTVSTFCHLLQVKLQWQQDKQASPDALPPSNIFQLVLGDSHGFPNKMRYIISPACSGSTPGWPPSWM